MRCVKPFVSRVGAFGCGQCLPCRVSKSRTWAHRIELEAMCHADNAFVTLTYAEDRRNLEIGDLQKWLKRFRKSIAPIKVRYVAVGEYGEISWRPHYHVALFGWPSCRMSGLVRGGECPCHACSVVRQTWGFGHVMVGRLETKSSRYIAGYVIKKMTNRLDTRLLGREPEFARMSLRPGIGANAMHDVASEILRWKLEGKDVPCGLQWQKNSVKPLGKYLRRKLRVLVGRSEKASPEALQQIANQMQILRSFAWSNDRSVSSVFAELFHPYEVALEAKLKLKQRKL